MALCLADGAEPSSVTKPTVPGWPVDCTRVVFFAPRTPETSGGAMVVHTLSVALDESGLRVEHISLEPGTRTPQFPTYVVDSRPELHRRSSFRVARGWRRRARGLVEVVSKRVHRARNDRRLRRLLESYSGDTALVFTHVSAKIAADRTGWKRTPAGPIVVGQHHSQFESIDLEEWLRGAIEEHFQDIDVFLALTEPDAVKFQQLLTPPCRVMPNPVPVPHVARRAARPEAVAISRLSGEKAIDAMARCFAAATEEPDLAHWSLTIYGEGDQREIVDAAIRKSGSTRIRLAGHCDDVHSVLADASVLLMTSWMEGLPMSILEAATMGVPTIAFDCSPGVHSLVGEERGFLVPPADEAAYTRTLAAALRAPKELERRGDTARQRAQSYMPGSILESWGRVLAACYDSRSERPA